MDKEPLGRPNVRPRRGPPFFHTSGNLGKRLPSGKKKNTPQGPHQSEFPQKSFVGTTSRGSPRFQIFFPRKISRWGSFGKRDLKPGFVPPFFSGWRNLPLEKRGRWCFQKREFRVTLRKKAPWMLTPRRKKFASRSSQCLRKKKYWKMRPQENLGVTNPPLKNS